MWVNPLFILAGKTLLKGGCAPGWGWQSGRSQCFQSRWQGGGHIVAAIRCHQSSLACWPGISQPRNSRRPHVLHCCGTHPWPCFQPILRFKGGKGLASALGVWIGLTIWKASLAGVIGTLLGIALTIVPGWAVLLGLVGILATLLIWIPDPMFLLVWAAEAFILVWTHHVDLSQPPKLQPWLAKHFMTSRK